MFRLAGRLFSAGPRGRSPLKTRIAGAQRL